LSRRFDNLHFANFTVDAGTIADHLPMLEYVVKDKAARHESLRAVFLLLDVDSLGIEPQANRYIRTLHPPELTGERPARFWWRNLRGFGWRGGRAVVWAAPAIRPRLRPAPAAPEQPGQLMDAGAEQHARITDSPHFPRQLGRIQRFVELCREHGIA